MRWSIGRRLAAAFSLPIVVLVIVGAASSRALDRSIETSKQVDQSYRVLRALQELYAVAAAADAQHLRYVLTGDDSLQEFREGLLVRAAELEREIVTLVADSGLQARRFDSVRIAIVAKLAGQRERDAVRRTESAEVTIARIPISQSVAVLEQFRAQFREMEEEEQRLLNERARANNASVASTKAVILWGGVGGLLLVTLVGTGTTRQLNAAIGDGIQSIVSSAGEILAATAEQAATTQEEATAVQETTTTVQELKQTAQLSAEKSRVVADGARETARASEEGQEAADRTLSGMREAKQRMQGIADHVLALSGQGRKIGGIIQSVEGLAEQSNLLAVNAAIEAAKAGDAGRGFAVVAAEVKALAEQSKQATAQVRQILGEIQQATHSAALASEQGVKASEEGEALARRSGETIGLLGESLEQSAQAAIQIQASAREQLVGVDQVAAAMQNIRQVTAQNLSATRQLQAAARDLNGLAQRFRQLVTGEQRADGEHPPATEAASHVVARPESAAGEAAATKAAPPGRA